MRIHTGVGHTHRQRVGTTFFTRKNSHKFFSCAPDAPRRGSNLGSSDLESNALPTEPPRPSPCLINPTRSDPYCPGPGQRILFKLQTFWYRGPLRPFPSASEGCRTNPTAKQAADKQDGSERHRSAHCKCAHVCAAKYELPSFGCNLLFI